MHDTLASEPALTSHLVLVIGPAGPDRDLVEQALAMIGSASAAGDEAGAARLSAQAEVAAITADLNRQARQTGRSARTAPPAPEKSARGMRAMQTLRGNGALCVLGAAGLDQGADLAQAAPFWLSLAHKMDSHAAAVLVVSRPARAADGVAHRTVLDWLNTTLEAERNTRGHPRCFILAEHIRNDWYGALASAGDTIGVDWRDDLASAASLIEPLADTYEAAPLWTIASPWLRATHEALAQLAQADGQPDALATLDRVYAEVNRALALFTPAMEALERERSAIANERDAWMESSERAFDRLAELEERWLSGHTREAQLEAGKAALAAELEQVRGELARSTAAGRHADQDRDGLGKQAAEAQAALTEAREALIQATAERDHLKALMTQASESTLDEGALTEARNALGQTAAERDHLKSLLGQNASELALARSRHLDDRMTAGQSTLLLDSARRNLAAELRRQIAFSRKPLARWLRMPVIARMGLGFRRAARLDKEAGIIEDFLDSLPWPLVGVAPDGRRERILAYLGGASEALEDFPFIRNREYFDLNPDVAHSKMPALVHFIRFGQAEERQPHPLFDTRWYLAHTPEARHLCSSALVHYLQWGAQKGCDPHPLFSTRAYQERYPDVGRSGRNPLLHALANPRCAVHPLFDADFYLTSYDDVARQGRHPLSYYLTTGWHQGHNPHPLFDTRYYRAHTPEAAGQCPLVHYVEHGWRERRQPSEGFDPAFYQIAYPDLGPEVDLLRHYVEHGQAEGRVPRDLAQPLPTPSDAASPPAASPVTSPLPAPRSDARVALMIDAFYPRPDRDSGSLDQISFIRIFQRFGYEVHFLALLDFAGDHDGESARYRQALGDMGVRTITSADWPYVESYYFDVSDRLDVAFGSRAHFGGKQLAALRQLCPAARLIFNTVDLHFIREQREGELRKDPAILRRAAETRELECQLAREADATIVVSSTEQVLLGEIEPQARVAVVPLIRDFGQLANRPFAQRQAIAFVGGFMHQPNVDAVQHFLSAIWPALHARRPDITLRIIGADMPETMRRQRVGGVEFVGYIEDLEAELAGLRMTIAPLRFGAGAKGKLVSSLGNGVPCVVSTVAAEGMGLVNGETVLVADLDDSFADAIIRLYDDEALWERLSAGGLDFIRRDYSLDAGAGLMRDLLQGMGLELPKAV